MQKAPSYFIDQPGQGVEKHGDLPIEQPMQLSLTVNQRTARALGLSIPQDLLLAALRVIE